VRRVPDVGEVPDAVVHVGILDLQTGFVVVRTDRCVKCVPQRWCSRPASLLLAVEFDQPPLRAHWSIPDPAGGSALAFRRIAADLDTRIRYPLSTLTTTHHEEVSS
jgi:hypothetical protein